MSRNNQPYQKVSSVEGIERGLITRARILMVDDEPILIELVRAFLEDAGYRAFQGVSDPAKALQAVQDWQPDVLLLDLMMPGVSGFDILGAIKADTDRRLLPVIVMTSASDPDTKLRVLELGATDFLAKPVDPSELILRLRNTLIFKANRDRLTYFDWLTNLPNRRLFNSQLGSALRRRTLPDTICVVIWIELGGVRTTVETLGQSAGDRVIQEAAQRLQQTVSTNHADPSHEQRGSVHWIARVSEYEFAVVMPCLANIERADEFARRLIVALRRPIVMSEQEIHLTVAIGIAASPNDGLDAERLVHCAQSATADARHREANPISFYCADLKIRAERALALEHDLRKALSAKEFEVYYQPKVETESNRITGAEALIRWRHPTRGLLGPSEFLPMAQQLGLIVDIGAWVLGTACRQAAVWRAEGLPACGISVNISTPHLSNGRLLRDVQAVLQETGLPAYLLTIEITESLMLENSEDHLQTLEKP